MAKLLLIFASVWVLLAFCFVFALLAAARKRVLSEKEAMDVKRAQELPPRSVPPSIPLPRQRVPEVMRA